MLNVLIVDDEYLVRYGLRESIDWRENGFNIIGEASDGEEGLELASKCRPEIIITDIKMPFMDGIEFMKNLHKENIDSKLIVLSGYDDFKYAKSAIDFGVFAYILKPVDNESLLMALNKVAAVIENENKAKNIIKSKLLNDMIVTLKRIIKNKSTTASAQVNDAVKYIMEHYNEDIDLNSIANELYISQYYLCHRFKEVLGTTVLDYITEYRIEKAKELLKDKKYKIYEVCKIVGYNDPRYFSQIFKKLTTMSPKEYSLNSGFERIS